MARKRKQGTGTVRQRKDGRWEGRAVVGYDDKGLPLTKNVLAKTKHACQEKLTKLLEEVGGTRPEKIRANMPFGEWMDFWYQNYIKPGLRPTTQSTYESSIYLHIIPQLGKVPLCQLTQKDLQQFYAYLKKRGGWSGRSSTARASPTGWCGCATPSAVRRWTRRCRRT